MSADAAIIFFGIKFTVQTEAELEQLETRQDERLDRSRKAKLHTWFGRITEGQPYHLLIGHQIAVLGVENQQDVTITQARLTELMRATIAKLKMAGFDPDKAELHCLLEADY